MKYVRQSKCPPRAAASHVVLSHLHPLSCAKLQCVRDGREGREWEEGRGEEEEGGEGRGEREVPQTF